jgi:hypothetical protein
MIRHTLSMNTTNRFSMDFAAVVDSLVLPPLVWLVTDLDLTLRLAHGVDLHVWQHRVLTAPAPGAAVSDREFRDLVNATDQMVDGEFIGFSSLDDLLAFRSPLVRIDAFDSTEWIVVIDPARVGVTADFRLRFGDGVDCGALRTRQREFPPITAPPPRGRLDLRLAGSTVDLVEIGQAVTMHFSNGVTLRLETAFAVTTRSGGPAPSDDETIADPARPTTLRPVLGLHARTVDRAVVDGWKLTIAFASGEVLSAWAAYTVPSWHFRDPGAPAVAIDVLAGGEVVVERQIPEDRSLSAAGSVGTAAHSPSSADRPDRTATTLIDGIVVPLRLLGSTVDRIACGFDLTLGCSDGGALVLGTPFTLSRDGMKWTVDPEAKSSLRPALGLRDLRIDEFRIDGDTLTAHFSDGSVLRAASDPEFEAWEYIGPERPATRVLAMPGGELAVWLSDDGSATDAG